MNIWGDKREALKRFLSKNFSRNTLGKEFERKCFSPSMIGCVPDGPKKVNSQIDMFKNINHKSRWVGK